MPTTNDQPTACEEHPGKRCSTSLSSHLRGVHFQPCCVDHRRYWEETRALKGLTASDHAPDCENYKTEKFFRVRISGEPGPSCILETQEEVDALVEANQEEEYDISEIEMTRDRFERLGEFDGF